MANQHYIPRPVFDTLDNVIGQYKTVYADNNPRQKIQSWLKHCFENTKVSIPSYAAYDYQLALNFLYSYRGSNDTFSAYRREIERFLQWSWFVREQSVLSHKRDDLETFIEFSIKPHKRWIGF